MCIRVYEILMTSDELDRSERMALVGTTLDARMLLWAQLRQIRRTVGSGVEMRETAFIDASGALCEGVEWVMRHPSRGWSALFTLYFRELEVDRSGEPISSSESLTEADDGDGDQDAGDDPF